MSNLDESKQNILFRTKKFKIYSLKMWELFSEKHPNASNQEGFLYAIMLGVSIVEKARDAYEQTQKEKEKMNAE